MWHLAIEMKRRNPERCIINDPSHICAAGIFCWSGAKSHRPGFFDGLMIESHIDPTMHGAMPNNR